MTTMTDILTAAKTYREAGIVTHPISSPTDKKASPGKRPILSGWQKLTEHPTDEQLEMFYADSKYNIGAVCGKASDLMVIDVDWYIKGMWDSILTDIDTSKWVKQYRTSKRWHWLFRCNPDFKLSHVKPLGIDLLGESGNVVMSPSVHESGEVYTIEGDIAHRPELDDVIVSRLTNVMKIYSDMMTTLNRCRATFRLFFEAVFKNEDIGKDKEGNKILNPLYHKLEVFRYSDGRARTLALCAELKANGADEKQLLLFCMMAFGNSYSEQESREALKHIRASATARTETIKADSILSQFYKPGDAKKDPAENRYCNIEIKKNGNKVIHLNYDAIAEGIVHELDVISYAEQLFVYEDGVYVEGTARIKAEILRIVKNLGYSGAIQRATNEIIHYMLYDNPCADYPFNWRDDCYPVNNGVVKIDYSTGKMELLAHCPDYRFNYKLCADYDPSKCGDLIHLAVIGKYVEPKYVDILYQIPAQALLQMNSEPYKKAYMLQGDPNAGKSTYLLLLELLFGIETISGESLHSLGDNRFAKANLEGKILNVYDDMSDIPMSDTGVFKTLTGKKSHSVEKKGKQAYMAPIGAVHVFTCNAPPSFDKKIKNDTAFWERWEYVYFPYTFPKDANFTKCVFTPENLSGFLNRVLKMVVDLKQNGLIVKSTAGEVRERWSFNSDPLYQFMQESIDFEKERMFVDKDEFREAVIRWGHAYDVDLAKIPTTKTGLTQTIDKYEVFPRRIVDANGVQVEVYELPGTWKLGAKFTAPRIAQKTEQSMF
ncbi:MAG: DUF5906 domain-containing protein [Methanosarcinaceae archaeon]